MLQLLQGTFCGSGSQTVAAIADAALCRQQLQQVTPFGQGATALTAVIVANVACVHVITEIAFPSLFLLLSRFFSMPRARKQHLQHWPSMARRLGCLGPNCGCACGPPLHMRRLSAHARLEALLAWKIAEVLR